MAVFEVGARSPGAVAVAMNISAALRERAAAGDEAAFLELAQRLFASPEAAQRDEAMGLVLDACERANPTALRLHATLAVRGLGRSQDLEEARALVTRAAALGDASAQGQLSLLDAATWQAPIDLRQHHTAPRIFTVERFISPEVCAYFVADAHGKLERSTVRDGVTGIDVVDPGRSASSAGTGLLEPDLVLQLTKLRIAEALATPVAHQEPTTFLRYEPGQEYLAHYDLIRPQEEAAAAEELRVMGQRVATVLVYLNEGYEGGETFFPHLDWGFKGKVGDALIFWNMSAAGERERLSLHAGLPVQSGEKWLLSQWVRAKPVPLI